MENSKGILFKEQLKAIQKELEKLMRKRQLTSLSKAILQTRMQIG